MARDTHVSDEQRDLAEREIGPRPRGPRVGILVGEPGERAGERVDAALERSPIAREHAGPDRDRRVQHAFVGGLGQGGDPGGLAGGEPRERREQREAGRGRTELVELFEPEAIVGPHAIVPRGCDDGSSLRHPASLRRRSRLGYARPILHPLLELTRDGKKIVVRSETGVAILDVAGRAAPRDLAIEDVQAIAAIADQLWVVAGARPVLTAYDLEGRAVSSTPVSPPSRTPYLHRAWGSKIASWSGDPQMTIAFEQRLVAKPLPAHVDFALPITSSRMLIASRQTLSLRDQDTARWTLPLAGLGTILDATLVFDGKAIALCTRGGTGGKAIVVLGLRDGAVLHRLTIPGEDTVRFAAMRGLALVASPSSRLVLIDLRFGRVILDHQEQRSIAAVAIDDGGREIAMIFAEQPGSVAHVAVADLIAAMSASAPAEPALPPEAPASEPPADGAAGAAEAAEAAPADPFHVDATLVCEALPQRLALEPTTAEETAILDDRERDLVIAMAGAAIARAWDEGRLAFPQPGGLPFHSEVDGLTSGQRGLAMSELEAAQRRLDEARAADLEARHAFAPRLGPLDALEHDFGLSPIGREILLLVAAPALWGQTARLYGILSNDDGRPLLDEHLLGELLFDRATGKEIARELDADAPLIRLGIVRIHAGSMRPFLPLVVEPVVLKLLRRASAEPELQPLVEVRASDRPFGALRIPAAVKHALVAQLARAAAPLRVVIRGRVGAGRHALAAEIAAASARELGVIDATPLARDPRRIGELANALDRAHLTGLLPCVDGLELLPSSDVATRDQVRELLRRHAGPLVVRLPGEVQPPLHAGYVLVDLPALSLSDRLVTWEQVLAAHRLAVSELGELADRYAIGPGVVERVAASVARAGDPEHDAGPRLDAAIRQHLETRLANTADRVTRLASWSQIILPADIEDSLTELIARIKHRRIVFDRWGFDRLLSTSRGVTALFQGGPGTGKTLVASAIANELGMDLYRVDLSRVMSKWIGETEQNLATLFDAAEDGNTIILFDEADSLFAKRTEVKSSVDRYANLEVNYLLQRIDTFEGIAILTTNFGTSIDNAVQAPALAPR